MSAQSQADTLPTDLEVALFLQREKHRLPDGHHAFIDAMVRLLTSPRPTPKQRQYLHRLFYELGGKIT